MNVHEYQAKEVFKSYSIPVPRGGLAQTPQEARKVAQDIGGEKWVIKAQVHAGGRGKAGGIKLASSLDEVEKIAGEMIGMTLVTHQTGPEGKKVRMVLVEEAMDIVKEYYVGLTLDRSREAVAIMASTEGGVEIEEVARTSPEKIFIEYLDPVRGFSDYQGRKLAIKLGLKEHLRAVAGIFKGLARLYLEKDCSLAEINPLVLTSDGRVLALDAKINFDDNALFRHPDVRELWDPEEEDPKEREAKEYDISYVSLSGDIGCLVNGAGLAMATMDIIKYCGGEPANFLDVGGGADKEKVAKAFSIILQDPNVKAILVNIFGGIMRCDVLAEGVVAAAKELGLKVPLVVRLEGTNVEKGREILGSSGLDIINASDMYDAARKVVEAAGGSVKAE